CGTPRAVAGASWRAPCDAAAARSCDSGDQPSTLGTPARFAWRASDPPIAPRPMIPSRVGRTQGKLAAAAGAVNATGDSAESPVVVEGRSYRSRMMGPAPSICTLTPWRRNVLNGEVVSLV